MAVATANPRVQVTLDPELGEALHAVDPHPRSKSRLIRDLALRGAQAASEERARRAKAQETLRKIATGEIDLDLDAAREVHEEREASAG